MPLSVRIQNGFNLLFIVFGVHILLGLYAIYFNGSFVFGATMPERYAVHLLYGGEMTFNPTGSSAYHMNDLCLQKCDDCKSLCYPYTRLEVDCNSCFIKTAGGNIIVNENDSFRAIANHLFVIENTTFKCYSKNVTECGFLETLESNYTILHKL